MLFLIIVYMIDKIEHNIYHLFLTRRINVKRDREHYRSNYYTVKCQKNTSCESGLKFQLNYKLAVWIEARPLFFLNIFKPLKKSYVR